MPGPETANFNHMGCLCYNASTLLHIKRSSSLGATYMIICMRLLPQIFCLCDVRAKRKVEQNAPGKPLVQHVESQSSCHVYVHHICIK